MKSLYKKFFKNLFRNILGQKEETNRKEKNCEKQDLTPLIDIKDDEQIKKRRKNKEPVKPQAELDLHGKTSKDTYDHDEITEDGHFFIENFHKYKPKENKDESYDEQIIKRSRKKKLVKHQAELDLHGKTSDEALMRLKSFIEGSRRRGLMCILIIVGKGNHSEGGRSVLRPIIETWLKSEGTTQISKYKNAPAEHGGSGAIQVWLK